MRGAHYQRPLTLRDGNVKEAATSVVRVLVTLGSPLADEKIACSIRDHLDWNLEVPKTIKFGVRGGRVTLWGIAESEAQREAAERTIYFLEGVREVNNKIEIASLVRQQRKARTYIVKITDM